MICRLTWVSIADNTNVNWLQVFHLYRGFHRKQSSVGFFIKGSARSVEPPRVEYKGFKFKYNRKGDVCRAILLRTRFPLKRNDGLVAYFPSNTGLLIRKKFDLKSKYLFGPAPSSLKRKKLKTLFKTIL